jgi:transposase
MDRICGVDVSKLFLDAGFANASDTTGAKVGASARFDNTPEGIAALAVFCRTHAATLVVMEATGGFEKLAFRLLWQEGLACAVCNPRNVRLYAEAMGSMEKSDAIDARIIAAFAAAKGLKPMPPVGEKQNRLKALATRLRQVTQDITVNKQRRSQCFDAEHKASVDQAIVFFKKEAKRLTGEIASLISDDPLWSKLDEAFRSIKGIADRTVAGILALLPEIGTYSNKAIAKLTGMAPIANDSGLTSNPRHIRGGRADVRSALFIVAFIVRQHNPVLAAFSHKLLKAGKPKMVVRIAIARKLLVWLNAKARDARKEFANAT